VLINGLYRMPFLIVFLITAVPMKCRCGCRLRIRWSCRVQGPDERNICIVGYL